MQSTNSEYGSPYLATVTFTFTKFRYVLVAQHQFTPDCFIQVFQGRLYDGLDTTCPIATTLFI